MGMDNLLNEASQKTQKDNSVKAKLNNFMRVGGFMIRGECITLWGQVCCGLQASGCNRTNEMKMKRCCLYVFVD